jgi:hypothetical protein
MRPTMTKRSLAAYALLAFAPWVIFLALYELYTPSLRSSLVYAAGLSLAAALLFFGEYGRIVLFTLYAIFISQPVIAHFFVFNFHTLQPHYSAVKKNNLELLTGVDPEFIVTTDSYGFRSNTPDAYSKKYKIFLIGGSTTEQLAQDDRKTTAALLEQSLGSSDYSVINTGVSGLRAVNHIATIDFIKKFRPFLVVILLGVNDWSCAVVNKCISSAMDPRNWPVSEAAFSVTNLLRLGGAWWSFDPATLMGRYDQKGKVELPDGKIGADLDDFGRDFTKLLRTCEAIAPTTCIITTQPTSYTVENFADPKYRERLWMTPPFQDWALTEESLVRIAAAYNNYIRKNTSCGNCMLFDLARLMDGNRRYFYDDVHFTNDGTKYFADELLDFLRIKGFVKNDMVGAN